MNKARHNNVVHIYGFAKWSGSIGVVMEYMPSGNLLEMVQDKSVQIGFLFRLRMSAEIASGLAFIHNLSPKRVVHGDLKPENILLTDDLHCKIADFGSSIISSYTGCESTRTAYGNRGDNSGNNFTLLFAAPELLQNNSMDLKPAVDTYSYGVVIFFLLRRERPITHLRFLEVYTRNVISGERPNLNFINNLLGEVSNNKNQRIALDLLTQTMKRCWKQEPHKRPLMVDVRDELVGFNREATPKETLLEVAAAVGKVYTYNPSPADYQCATIDQFASPQFNQLIGKLNQYH